MSTPIPIIDLFAGPGGLNEGFNAVRDNDGNPVFKTVVSVECEATAHRTLELRAFYRLLRNSGSTKKYFRYLKGEITRDALFDSHSSEARQASQEAMLARLGEDNTEIHERISDGLKAFKGQECLIIGGPPCQAYSLIGRANAKAKKPEFQDDVRHTLYQEYLTIVNLVRPLAFVMENVTGLLSATHKGSSVFNKIREDFIQAGYSLYPLAPPSDNFHTEIITPRDFVISADEFGVPQRRNRVILFGIRNDSGLQPGTIPRGDIKAMNVVSAISDLPLIRSKLSRGLDSPDLWLKTIRDVISHKERFQPEFHESLQSEANGIAANLPLGAPFMIASSYNNSPLKKWYYSSERPDGFIFNHNSRGHMPSDIQRYFAWSIIAKQLGRSPSLHEVPSFLLPNHTNVLDGDLNNVPFSDRFRVQLEKMPSTTVVSHIAKDGHYYIHYDPTQCRSLSVREAARLQTFPDDYFFEGPPTDQYRQVGNAVPPYLASLIAQSVWKTLCGDQK